MPVIIEKFVTIFFCVHRDAFEYRNNKGVLRFVIHVTRLLAKKKSAKKCQDSNAKQRTHKIEWTNEDVVKWLRETALSKHAIRFQGKKLFK